MKQVGLKLSIAMRLISVAGLVMMTLSGCSLMKMKADEAKDSGFLKHPEKMQEAKGVNKKWASDKYKKDRSTYTQVMVRPVSTDFLEESSDWSHIQIRSEEGIKKDAEDIAKFMEEEFKKALRDGKAHGLKLVKTPGPNTMVMEMALVELIPTDVVRNSVGDVLGFIIPGGGLVAAGAGGSIAFEMRIVDGETKELLLMIKDRRVDEIAPIDIAGLTPYRHAEQNIDDWVNAITDGFNTPIEEEIHTSSEFTLSPW